MLFSSNGYKLVVMPMLTDEANEQAKTDRQAKAEQLKAEQAEPVAEPVAEQKPKKRNRKKVAVAVA